MFQYNLKNVSLPVTVTMSIEEACESDSSDISFPKKRRRVVLFSSSEDDTIFVYTCFNNIH